MVSRLVVQDVKLHKLERHREDTLNRRVRIETAMRSDKDGGEARVVRAEIARAVASGSSMEIEPPLAAPAEPPPPSSTGTMLGAETPRAGPMLGAETPSIGASSSRKRTAAEGGDETATAMADNRGNSKQLRCWNCVLMNFVEVRNPVCFSKSAHTIQTVIWESL